MFAIPFHGRGHKFQSYKNKRKTGGKQADFLYIIVLCQHGHEHTDESKSLNISGKVKRTERRHKPGYRRAYVCAHNHSGCLRQTHDADVDKSDNQHGCNARTLHKRGGSRSYSGVNNLLVRRFSEQFFDFTRGKLFDIARHKMYANQENSGTGKQFCKKHNNLFCCHKNL